MSTPLQEDVDETLFQKIVKCTLADLASLSEWDEDSLADLGTLLAGSATPLPEALVAIIRKRGPRSDS